MAVAETNETGVAIEHSTASSNRLVQFLKDTRQEMRKVVNPSPTEVRSMTTTVVVTVFLFAAYFELVDLVLGTGIDKLFLKLTKH